MIRSISIFLFLWAVTLVAHAQATLSTKNKKAIAYYTEADNFRVRAQYQQAIQLLELALDKDENFFEAYYRLGLVYMDKHNFNEAIKNFNKGLGLATDPAKQKQFWYDLGDAYFAIGEYDKANKFLSDFLRVEILNKRQIEHAKQVLQNVEFAMKNSVLTSKYKLHALSDTTVNKFVLQYFPVLTADQQELIFTRRLGTDMARNDHSEDIVVSRKNKQGQWTTPVSISPVINTPGNEGTATISADGRRLIFASSDDRGGYGSCDLYESNKIGDAWSQPINLGINVNTPSWESQPTLSADGRTLYFVSERRGGVGHRDIYVTFKNGQGWTKAKNAGKTINTVYDEISPFIHVNNKTLYFASNGLTGFGGFDIFYSEKDTADAWTTPINIGAPINNHEDQFSLFITADGKKGYYSHEQASTEMGFSPSKIYEVEIPEESQVKFKSNYVKGVVRDKKTGVPLTANIELIDLGTGKTESFVKSDSVTGNYLIVLTQGAEYALYVNKLAYLFTSKNFNYSEVKDFKPIVLDIDLEKIQVGSLVVLNNLFFDIDKYGLKDKSKTELQKIINFLTENPSVRIEIGGHTDTTGSLQYNLELSDRRARAVYTYLLDRGIKPAQVTSKGYGPGRPIAPNDAEETRKLNRRIEFKITQ